ncbi:MAG: hypothetical protein RR767_12240 [Acinetobacter sp.]
MAVSEQTPYKEYTANGSTNSFALDFDCDNQDHLIVLVDDVEPVVGTWSLSGGAVVFGTAPINGNKITIQRNTPVLRSTNFQSFNNSFRPDTINKDLDRLWLKFQELGVADMLLRIYIDRLHLDQKTYINDQDLIIKNIISDLRNYANQQYDSISSSINNLRNHVDTQDSNQNNYFTDQIQKQGVSLQQLNDYYNYLIQRIAAIAIQKGWEAIFVADKSGRTQQQINDDVINAVSCGVKNDGVTDVKTAFTTLANSMNDGETLYLPKGTYYWDATTGTANINKNINIKGEGAVIKVKGYNGYTPFISFNCTDITTFAASDVLNSLSKNTTKLDIKGTPIPNPAEYFVVITSTERAIHRPLFAEDYTKNITLDIVDNNYSLRDPLPYSFNDLSKATIRFVKKELPTKISGFTIIPTDDYPELTYYLQFSYKSRLTIESVTVDTRHKQSAGVLFHYNRCMGVTTTLSGGLGANKGDVNYNTYIFEHSCSSYLKYDRVFYADSDYKEKSTKGIGGRHGFMIECESCMVNGVDDHWGHSGFVRNMHMNGGITWAGGSLTVENCYSNENLVQLRTDTPYADGVLTIKNSTSRKSVLNAYGHQWTAQQAADFCTHKVWDVINIEGTFDSSLMDAAVVLIKEPNIQQTDVFRDTILNIKCIYIQAPSNSRPVLEVWSQSGVNGEDLAPLAGDLNLKKLFSIINIEVLHLCKDDPSVTARKSLIVGGVADEYFIKSNNLSFSNIRADRVTMYDSNLIDNKTEINTVSCNKLYLNNFKFMGGKSIWIPDATSMHYPDTEVHLLNPHAQHQNIIAGMFGSKIKSSRGGVFTQGWKTAIGWDLTNYDRDFCTTYTLSSELVIPANSSSSELYVTLLNGTYDSFVQPLLVLGEGDIVVDMIRKRTGLEYRQYFKLRNTSANPVTIPVGTVIRFKLV